MQGVTRHATPAPACSWKVTLHKVLQNFETLAQTGVCVACFETLRAELAPAQVLIFVLLLLPDELLVRPQI